MHLHARAADPLTMFTDPMHGVLRGIDVTASVCILPSEGREKSDTVLQSRPIEYPYRKAL